MSFLTEEFFRVDVIDGDAKVVGVGVAHGNGADPHKFIGVVTNATLIDGRFKITATWTLVKTELSFFSGLYALYTSDNQHKEQGLIVTSLCEALDGDGIEGIFTPSILWC